MTQKLSGFVKKWRETVHVEDRLAQFKDLPAARSRRTAPTDGGPRHPDLPAQSACQAGADMRDETSYRVIAPYYDWIMAHVDYDGWGRYLVQALEQIRARTRRHPGAGCRAPAPSPPPGSTP